VKALFADGNIKFGDSNSKLLFVEFSDPSCPFCHVAAGKHPELNKTFATDPSYGGRYSSLLMVQDGGTYVAPVPEMKKLVDQGKAAFVWLYANGHGNGEMGTQALYCANEKGKFWEAHDLLMSKTGYDILNNSVKNDKSKSGDLAEFLKDVVNKDEMKSCLDSGKYASRISSDQTLASQYGFNGTPYFFVNTQTFSGAYNYNDMKPYVNSALN
jgi:protein-disulfide isomerase